MARKPPDPETVGQVLATYAITGSQQATSKETGIPDSTVQKWVTENQEDVERLRRVLQEKYGDDLLQIGRDLLAKVKDTIGKVDVKSAKDLQALMTAFGINMDKQARLAGIADKFEFGITGLANVSPADLETRERLLGERRRALQSLVIDVPRATPESTQ
jgi:hypothetical protein